MGDLKDTVELIGSVLKGDTISMNKVNNLKYSSIAKMASEGTLQFPVLVSSSIDIETAQNISKALERNYSTFVQTALSLFPSMAVNGSNDVTAANFIKQFHQNNGGFDTFDLIANIAEGYTTLFSDENVVFESAIYNGKTKTIEAKNKEQLIDLMESVRIDILNNKYIPKAEITYNFKDKKLSKKFNSLTEANDDWEQYKYYQTERRDNHNKRLDGANYKLNKDKFYYQKERDEYNTNVQQNSGDYMRDVLRDNDVRKANELIATTLHIRVKLFNKNTGTNEGSVDFIIGVKCTMHVVKTNEMIVNLVGACTNNDRVFNFLRWTTGEISFFKDFLFNIKEIKDDVANRKSGSSPWWLALKKRRLLGKSKRAILSNKQLLPNATIVINAEEAEYIKTQYGYDLFNPLFINKIMDQYYLLGFVVVDNSAQVAHFIFENDRKDYQTITFSALEKAGSNDERKFKEMLKAVNRF